MYLLGFCRRAQAVYRRLDDGAEVSGLHAQTQFAGDDARSIKQIVNHLHLHTRISPDDFNGAGGIRRVERGAP